MKLGGKTPTSCIARNEQYNYCIGFKFVQCLSFIYLGWNILVIVNDLTLMCEEYVERQKLRVMIDRECLGWMQTVCTINALRLCY